MMLAAAIFSRRDQYVTDGKDTISYKKAAEAFEKLSITIQSPVTPFKAFHFHAQLLLP